MDLNGSAPVYINADARPDVFDVAAAGGFVRPDELLADLEPSTDGWELRFFNGGTMFFDADGVLTAQSSWSGQRVVVNRDAAGRIEQLVASTGQTLTFTYRDTGTGSRVESAVMSDGRTATYSYDSAGNLIGVANPDSVTAYAVDPTGLILTESDATGVVVHPPNSTTQRRVIRQFLAHGEETKVRLRRHGPVDDSHRRDLRRHRHLHVRRRRRARVDHRPRRQPDPHVVEPGRPTHRLDRPARSQSVRHLRRQRQRHLDHRPGPRHHQHTATTLRTG